jgi:hypothetical protein
MSDDDVKRPCEFPDCALPAPVFRAQLAEAEMQVKGLRDQLRRTELVSLMLALGLLLCLGAPFYAPFISMKPKPPPRAVASRPPAAELCVLDHDFMTDDGLIWNEGYRVPCKWMPTFRDV